MTKLFQLLFPTRITNFGESLFFVTWEDSTISRQMRIGRLNPIVYRMALEKI